MSKLQVLVTAMHQTGLSLYEKMNLQTDAVIGNQADRRELLRENKNGCSALMVTTPERGTSKNRNTAIAHIGVDAEYVMFSDDDLRFYDGYEHIVCRSFADNPNADAIHFNLHSVSERKISMKPITTVHRVSRREVTSWGVCGLAIRTAALQRCQLCFNERFGPGTDFYCGEDTIFLQELFKKGLRVYASPVYIADIDQDDSSWFEGFCDRYFRASGAVLYEMYPCLSRLLAWRSALKFSRRASCTLGFFRILQGYREGIQENSRYHRKEKEGKRHA